MDTALITHPDTTRKTIQSLASDGADRIHVLADFDRTMTKAFINGKEVPSLIAILRSQNYLTPDYADKAEALYQKYGAIEKDPKVSDKEKKEAMHEWWLKHADLLMQSGLTRDDVRTAMQSDALQLRTGALNFLHLLHAHHIPLLFMSSSGLGADAIRLFLEHEKVYSDTIHIISNTLVWNDLGHFQGFREPIIHSCNKDETLLSQFPEIHKQVRSRPNVLLLGNSLGDADMIQGFDYSHLLKIGFLNTEVEKRLPSYQKVYDIVIPHDGPFHPINDILHRIITS